MTMLGNRIRDYFIKNKLSKEEAEISPLGVLAVDIFSNQFAPQELKIECTKYNPLLRTFIEEMGGSGRQSYFLDGELDADQLAIDYILFLAKSSPTDERFLVQLARENKILFTS